ncbi:MAG TPA: efflux RND transporter periplasmic adaptor subunit [Vicinamibacterales bacterium]|nr:efflux RND transporter periplasmic adaptor subunit [Vicinamibacterales bacterium]
MLSSSWRTRVTVGALSVLALTGCRSKTTAETPDKVASAGPPTVEVVTVVEQPLNVTLSLPGELTPYQTVALYSRVTGFVKSIAVDRGSRVRAGEQLAVLEAPELGAQKAEAQSKLQSAEAQLAAVRAKADGSASTYEKLKAASATPGVVAGNDVVLAQKTMEADQSQISAATQNVEAARQALKSVSDMEGYLRITAPFSGIVTERNVHPGALVGPTGGPGTASPIVRIVESNRLRLVIPVPEAYTAGVANGSSLAFSVAAYPGQTFNGTISRISQSVDVATRTMAVELDVNNADGRLAPGTFCQVKWPVRRTSPSLLVPNGSVASTTGRTFVIRVRSGRTEWVDVKTGLTSGSLIEVFGDLRPGDAIAARGTDELKAGASVQVKPTKPA